MRAIYKREMKAYATGITAYVFAVFLLFFAGLYTVIINLVNGYSSFEYVLRNMGFLFLIIIPILTMRVIAGERHQRTDQLLYALPLRMDEVVWGKYLALLTVSAVPFAVMLFYPLILKSYGSFSLSAGYTALLGFFLLAASLTAIGLFISSLTDNPAAAAGICFVVMLILYLMNTITQLFPGYALPSAIAAAVFVLLLALLVRAETQSSFAAYTTFCAGIIITALVYHFDKAVFVGLFAKVMGALSLYKRFDSFVEGVLDLNNIIYYLSVILVMLFLTTQAMEKRRWA